MLHGQAPDPHLRILIHQGVGFGIDAGVAQVKIEPGGRVPKLRGQHLIQAGRADEGQRLSAAGQVHGAQQAEQPKHMVAVQMGNEHGPQALMAHPVFEQPPLCALAAVEQVLSGPGTEHLRRRVAPQHRRGRRAAHNL